VAPITTAVQHHHGCRQPEYLAPAIPAGDDLRDRLPVYDPTDAYTDVQGAIQAMNAVPNNMGLGVIYWEPEAPTMPQPAITPWAL